MAAVAGECIGGAAATTGGAACEAVYHSLKESQLTLRSRDLLLQPLLVLDRALPHPIRGQLKKMAGIEIVQRHHPHLGSTSLVLVVGTTSAADQTPQPSAGVFRVLGAGSGVEMRPQCNDEMDRIPCGFHSIRMEVKLAPPLINLLPLPTDHLLLQLVEGKDRHVCPAGGSGGATCRRLLLEPFGPASRDGRVAAQAAQRIEPCGKRVNMTTTLLTAIGPSCRLVIKPSLHRREAQPRHLYNMRRLLHQPCACDLFTDRLWRIAQIDEPLQPLKGMVRRQRLIRFHHKWAVDDDELRLDAEELVQAEDGLVALREGCPRHAPYLTRPVTQVEQSVLPDASRHVNLLVLVYSLRILRLVEDRLVALVEDEAVETERVRVGNRHEEVLEIVADVLEARDQHARCGDNSGPRRLVAEPHELGRIGYDRDL